MRPNERRTRHLMTNKETLDLCDVLGIGVKSHSSSIVDAQADRVRRKTEREGLIRDEQPEEPAPAKKTGKAKKAAAKAPAPTEEPAAPAATDAPAPAEPAPVRQVDGRQGRVECDGFAHVHFLP